MRKLNSVLLSLLVGLGAQAAPNKEPDKTPIVFVDKARTSELFDVLLYPARLIPQINATVLSDSDGIVSKIQAPLGTTVHSKQIVMKVTNTDPIYNYAPLKVEAPVSGVVSSVDVTEGSRVTRGQKLATITDPKHIRINMEITAADLGSIRPGMEGELRVAGQETSVTVKVLGVSPFVDPASGTASAELGLANRKNAGAVLMPGVVGTVTFRANQHKGIEIPEYALIYRGQEPFVRVIENNKAKFVAVKLASSRRGSVEVSSGLAVGTTFVVRANTYVADGETVSVEKQEAPGR